MRLRGAGFTLIELMIVVAVLGIFIEGVPAFFRAVYAASARMRASEEMLASVRTVDAVLGRDIRSASDLPDRLGALTASDRCLILRLPSLSPGRPAGFDHVVFRADPGDETRLIKEVVPGPGGLRKPARQVLASGLESFRFSRSSRLVAWEARFRIRSAAWEARGSFASAAAPRRWGL